MDKSPINLAGNIFGQLKKDIFNLIVIFILLAGIWIRIYVYGDLRLSIGMQDTESFISSSAGTSSPSSAFISRRLATTNLLYKLMDHHYICELSATSNPYSGEEGYRLVQPCFSKIVLIQNILSIIGWPLLAWSTARYIRFSPYKLIVSIIILAFGTTPQIAEWDSVLSSESLSVSLLPIILALTQMILFSFDSREKRKSNINRYILAGLWVLTFSAWLFVRDVHIYSIFIIIIMLIPFIFVESSLKKTAVIAILVFLCGLFAFGNYTSKISPRWQPSLKHVLEEYIFPYPTREKFFLDLGMPSNKTNMEYSEWFEANGLSTYGKFLITHPGFVLTTMLEKSEYFRSDFLQPHFKSPENRYRDIMLILGEIVHPETYAVYLIDLLLIISLWSSYFKNRNSWDLGWAGLGTWIFLYAALSLLLTLFGDIDGTRRHIYPSVELFRLFLWIFLTVQADQSQYRYNEHQILSFP